MAHGAWAQPRDYPMYGIEECENIYKRKKYRACHTNIAPPSYTSLVHLSPLPLSLVSRPHIKMEKDTVKESSTAAPFQHDSSDSDSLQYTTEIGGNTSEVTYQDASGAPVEVNSPLGYSVGPVTVVFLNLSKMIGTGVFSTRSYISIRIIAWKSKLN
jgi:hypothetical protein